MNFIKAFLVLIWRIWFYLLVAVPIIVLFPILLIFSSKEKWYPKFFWLARNIWANIILYGMGVFPKIYREQKMTFGKSCMLVGNHTSMLDIMMMLKVSKTPFVFVGKKELSKIPVFGFFYKRVCILVDRTDSKSRSAVYKRAQERLDSGLSICIFPEGGVPEEDVFLDNFKDGAFRLALQYQIPIVPVTFADNKQRFPYTFFNGSLGISRAKVHSAIETKGLESNDKVKLKNETRTVILNQLQEFHKK
ncbi:1-acyl-sn-glycerol-3-phosphate acyltransferase [Pustulibacterium marinum]|uniref:1-acyl-sn-glycerol-3-phosphate acyltransferase n=1 Tax=Pustulibacterium marinum TaxID=1224947 RepID=A0A1I7EU55_9FLAO|nr:lysophospholipid acyltransferase family protein [Pustulibacterium marinum]SFU27461.1 1-acyl-sn-glycerol-3-phosphate acyltransferase [Pustulibacterium marinum]